MYTYIYIYIHTYLDVAARRCTGQICPGAFSRWPSRTSRRRTNSDGKHDDTANGDISLSLYIYIYIYTYVHVYIYIYIYIYICVYVSVRVSRMRSLRPTIHD